MKAFFALCRINFKGLLLASGQHRKAGKKAASGLGALVMISLVCLYLGGIYSFLLASQLAPVGAADLVLALMAGMAVLASFFFCVFGTSGFVFGARDNSLLLSLPISSFVIVLSKLVALYLENLFFSVCVLLPALFAHLRYGGAAAPAIAFFLPVLLILPLLPTALSLVLSFCVSWFESRAKHKALISILLNLAFFAVLMIGSLRLNAGLAQIAQNADSLRSGIATFAPPLYWVRDILAEGSLGGLLKLSLLCFVSFFAVALLFSRSYKKLLSRLESRSARTDYRLGRQQANSIFAALYKKELRRYLGSTVYLFNTIVGMLLLLGGAVYGLVARAKLLEIFAQMGASGSDFLPLLCIGIGFMVAMTAVTAPSISLEGKQLWILKEAPIPTATIFRAKLALHLTVTVPALVISIPCIAFTIRLSIWDGALLLALALAMALLVGLMGLYINLKLPKLDGVNDMVVVKQSASVLVAMFGGFAMLGIGALIFWFGSRFVGPVALLCFLLGLLVLGCIAFGRLLSTKGERLFAELS